MTLIMHKQMQYRQDLNFCLTVQRIFHILHYLIYNRKKNIFLCQQVSIYHSPNSSFIADSKTYSSITEVASLYNDSSLSNSTSGRLSSKLKSLTNLKITIFFNFSKLSSLNLYSLSTLFKTTWLIYFLFTTY